jgi:fused signal recognition particle receptor
MGIFGKIKEALGRGVEKTKTALATDIRDLFKKQGRLVDESFLDDLQEILIKSDMGVAASQEIIDEVKSQFRARKVEMEDILDIVRDKLRALMKQEEVPIKLAESGPTVIMVVGVNGSGKTTSIAKLANLFKSQGKSVVLGAGDTFRAAAVEQLTIWAERLGVDIVTAPPGADPASVGHRAVARALETGADICIVDTAGRLQTQTNLMQELTKIHRVLGKQIPEAPHEVLLVLDATTGQPGISQAQGFTQAVNCTGIILAKLDGTAKGGVVVPIRQKVGLPVKFIGVGEQIDDLEPFNSEAFIEALFAGL